MLNLRQLLFGDVCHERHSRETLAELNFRPAIDDLALEEELAWSTDSLRN